MSNSRQHKPTVERYAEAELPSRFGPFQVVVYRELGGDKEHLAVIAGEVDGAEDLLIRVHSECLTGEALHSLRCDCRDQLTSALQAIGEQETGMVLYLRQEGRGIGLLNKLRAYGLQDQGLDTVDANLALGFRDDERDYSVAAHMLELLQVRSVKLMTNNPKKVEGLRELGMNVTGRVPHVIPANEYNQFYLETKAARSGHLIDLDGHEHLLEQIDHPVVEGMDDEAAEAVGSLGAVGTPA